MEWIHKGVHVTSGDTVSLGEWSITVVADPSLPSCSEPCSRGCGSCLAAPGHEHPHICCDHHAAWIGARIVSVSRKSAVRV
jgi:hypothetical protein